MKQIKNFFDERKKYACDVKNKKSHVKKLIHMAFVFIKNFFYALLNPLNLLLKCGCFNLRIAFCSI